MTKESQNIEWKHAWHDDYLKWICGFANAQGGLDGFMPRSGAQLIRWRVQYV